MGSSIGAGSVVVNGKYSLAGATSKPNVLPGSAQTFNSNITAITDGLPAVMKVSLLDSNGTALWSEDKPLPAMSEAQTASMNSSFPVPESMPPGRYTFVARIFTADMASVLLDAPNLASFNVVAPIRVSVGNPTAYTDTNGRVWAADSGFSGLSTASTENVQTISNSADQPLWNSFRWGQGDFAYTATVPAPGKYKVTLRWVEHYVFAPGKRLFNVQINGAPVLTAFDLFVAAGGAFKAYDRSFIIDTASTAIRIDFTHGTIENPKINAIEILGAP